MVGRLIHPVTGELLEDGEAAWQAALNDADAAKGALLRRVRDIEDLATLIQLELAELRGKAVLPAPRNRTRVQERVSVCPRCGDRSLQWLDDEPPQDILHVS